MINIGETLTLEFFQQGEIQRYRCKLVEQAGSFLFVDYPINRTTGRTEIFPVGTEFLANFVDSDGSVYQFATEIKGKKKWNVNTLALTFPGEKHLKRIQRREYVRIESSVDIAIHEKEGRFPAFTTITYDISGGGTSILLPHGQSADLFTKFDMWMVLPMESGGYEYIYAEGKSIRLTEGNEGKNALSIKFEQIDNKDRQLIIRYCFERQLRERRQSTS